jgi:molecular chaperone Hsp33
MSLNQGSIVVLEWNVEESVFRYLNNDKTLRGVVVTATQVCEQMRQVHGAGPVATVAMGRAIIGALLLSGRAKEGHCVGLSFQGDGPLERIFAEASYDGEVRSYAGGDANLKVYLDSHGGILTGPSLGKGLLTVFEGLRNRDEPHRATVDLVSGEIADDIAYYMHQSFQIQSLVHLGVFLGPEGEVLAAGGVLLELLPGVTDETVSQLEDIARHPPGLSTKVREGGSADELISLYLGPMGFSKVGQSPPIRYTCRCNSDRLYRSLLLLGASELRAILKEQRPITAHCEFCGRKYIAEMPTIVELLKQLGDREPH